MDYSHERVSYSQPSAEAIELDDLAYDDEALLTDAIYAELEARGYTREELPASAHTSIARKL